MAQQAADLNTPRIGGEEEPQDAAHSLDTAAQRFRSALYRSRLSLSRHTAAHNPSFPSEGAAAARLTAATANPAAAAVATTAATESALAAQLTVDEEQAVPMPHKRGTRRANSAVAKTLRHYAAERAEARADEEDEEQSRRCGGVSGGYGGCRGGGLMSPLDAVRPLAHPPVELEPEMALHTRRLSSAERNAGSPVKAISVAAGGLGEPRRAVTPAASAAVPLVRPSAWVCLGAERKGEGEGKKEEAEEEEGWSPMRTRTTEARAAGDFSGFHVLRDYPFPPPPNTLLASELEECVSQSAQRGLHGGRSAAVKVLSDDSETAPPATPAAGGGGGTLGWGTDASHRYGGAPTMSPATASTTTPTTTTTVVDGGGAATLARRLSSCLPAERMEQSFLLQSPVFASLHHPFPRGAMHHCPSVESDLCSDSVTVAHQVPPPLCTYARLSSLPGDEEKEKGGSDAEVTQVASPSVPHPAVPKIAFIGSESWEAQRVRRSSAMRRSHTGSLVSTSVSGRSFFSASLRSPAPRAQSGMRPAAADSRLQRCGSACGAPTWTSLSPRIRTTTLRAEPLLPRTLSAPPGMADSMTGAAAGSSTASTVAAAAAAAARGATCGRCVGGLHSPVSLLLSEEWQRGVVPLSMREQVSRDSAQPSRNAPWRSRGYGGRYSLPRQDSERELELSASP